MLFLTIVLACLHLDIISVAADTGYKALKFGDDVNSYISYNPDLPAINNGYSLCSWIRNMGSSTATIWFTYPSGTETNWFWGKGYYKIAGSKVDLRNKFTSKITRGPWYHICSSWSSQENRVRVYWNGILEHEQTVSNGKTVPAGQTLILGNYRPGGHAWYFGGEMYALNMYKKELTAAEVKDIATGGLCPDDDSRIIRWEDVLKQTRSGNVVEIDAPDIDQCKSEREPSELDQIKEQLQQCNERLSTTTQDLQDTQQKLSSTTQDLQETQQKLSSTSQDLQETQQKLSSTTQELQETQQELSSMTQKLEEVTQQQEKMAQCLENKIENNKKVKQRKVKRVIGQFKTCRNN